MLLQSSKDTEARLETKYLTETTDLLAYVLSELGHTHEANEGNREKPV